MRESDLAVNNYVPYLGSGHDPELQQRPQRALTGRAALSCWPFLSYPCLDGFFVGAGYAGYCYRGYAARFYETSGCAALLGKINSENGERGWKSAGHDAKKSFCVRPIGS